MAIAALKELERDVQAVLIEMDSCFELVLPHFEDNRSENNRQSSISFGEVGIKMDESIQFFLWQIPFIHPRFPLLISLDDT
jgi:hypothetical protein